MSTTRLDRERWADVQAEAKRIMEAFEGRQGDMWSHAVLQIEDGFDRWCEWRYEMGMDDTTVDVWFRWLAKEEDPLHATIEDLRDKLHKYILYRYWIALCVESERNEATPDALVGIAVDQFLFQVSSSWGRTIVPKVLALQEGVVDIQDNGKVRSFVEAAGITVKEQSVLAALDTVTQEEEPGAPDHATKKRKILKPLTGFKAAGYAAALAQTSGEGAAGGGVPAAEEPTEAVDDEMNMGGPYVRGEGIQWSEVREVANKTGFFRSATGPHILNDLVKAERFLCWMTLELEYLYEGVQADGEFVRDHGLPFVTGGVGDQPVPPDAQVLFDSDTNPVEGDVQRFETTVCQLAHSMREATAQYHRLREKMQLKQCQHFVHDREQGDKK